MTIVIIGWLLNLVIISVLGYYAATNKYIDFDNDSIDKNIALSISTILGLAIPYISAAFGIVMIIVLAGVQNRGK